VPIRAVYENRLQSGEGGCPVRTKEGTLDADADVRNFLCKNLRIF